MKEYKDLGFLYNAVSHLFRLGPENRVTLGSGQESATARGLISECGRGRRTSHHLSCAHEHPKD